MLDIERTGGAQELSMQPQTFVEITGSMRSGTSLLGHILQQAAADRRAHPD
jgi:hypothetical protein